MTPEERVDQALSAVLEAAGTDLKYFERHEKLGTMRAVMRDIMKSAYIKGSNDCHAAMNRLQPVTSCEHYPDWLSRDCEIYTGKCSCKKGEPICRP